MQAIGIKKLFLSQAFFPLLLILSGILLWSGVLGAPFVYDDYMYIVHNPEIMSLRNFSGFSGTRYFGFLSFALNYAATGLDPFWFHLTNVFIHSINAVLVFYLVAVLSKTLSPDGRGKGEGEGAFEPVAIISSFIFLIHPIQTEAVNYISQRFTSLATFFYLLALVSYALSRVHEKGGWKKPGLYIVSLISTIAAMKTKEFGFTIPFAITAYEFIFFAGSAKSRALRLLPFYLMLPIIPLTLFAPDMGLGRGGGGIEEELRVLQLKEAAVLQRAVYSYTQLKVIARYLGMFFWPKGQTILHSPKLVHSILELEALLPLALLLSLLSIAAYALWRSRKSKALYGALFSFGVFFFFIGLFIESFAVPIKQLMAERRFYLPGIGIIIASASILMCGADRLRDKGYLNVSRTAAAFIILALSSPLLYAGLMERNRVWSDDEALLTEAIEASPGWPRLYFVRGVIYDLRHDYKRALSDYNAAVKLNPAFKDAYNNRGYLYYEAKEYGKAVEDFNRAEELAPGDYWVYFNRGLALAGLGKYKEAAEDFSASISLDPGRADAYNNRGVMYRLVGEKEKAASDLNKACSMGYESACENLGKMKANAG